MLGWPLSPPTEQVQGRPLYCLLTPRWDGSMFATNPVWVCHAWVTPEPFCLASAGPSGGALPPFYLFPTGNAFHGSCLAAEVATLSTPANKKRIQGLVQRLAQVRQS